MTTTEELRHPLDTARAALIVALAAVGMSVATWLFLNTGSQVLPGILVWIGWGLYPGLAVFVAARARSELAVARIAILTPTLIATCFMASQPRGQAQFLLAVAIAAGIFVGMWVAGALMRRRGRGWSLLGFILGGLSGGVVTFLVSLPALLLVSSGGLPRS